MSNIAAAFDHVRLNGARVMSNSWGLPPWLNVPQAIHDAMNRAIDAGVLIFFASGNSSGDIPAHDLAAHPGVIAVGGVSDTGRHVSYSTGGAALDLIAPTADFDSGCPATRTIHTADCSSRSTKGVDRREGRAAGMTERNLETMYGEYVDRHLTMSPATATGTGDVSCATVYFHRNDDDSLVFGCQGETRKAKQLRENPRVAAALDDGGKSAMGVQIQGSVVESTSPTERAATKQALQARHSAAAQSYDLDRMAFFRIDPRERYLINFAWGLEWRQRVMDARD